MPVNPSQAMVLQQRALCHLPRPRTQGSTELRRRAGGRKMSLRLRQLGGERVRA